MWINQLCGGQSRFSYRYATELDYILGWGYCFLCEAFFQDRLGIFEITMCSFTLCILDFPWRLNFTSSPIPNISNFNFRHPIKSPTVDLLKGSQFLINHSNCTQHNILLSIQKRLDKIFITCHCHFIHHSQ